MTEREIKKSIKEISPIDVYKLLPKTNCKECGETNCLAFATRLVNGEMTIEDCPPLLKDEYKKTYEKLQELLAPTIKTVIIGAGDNAVKIGGKHVLYRHEFTYHNPTPIAIDVTDVMSDEELEERIKKTVGFSYNYIGRNLTIDAVAIRSISNDPTAFKSVVEKVAKLTQFPLIFCTFNPEVMEAGLIQAKDRRPLIYAATKDNWKDMAELALMYNCPLVIFAPNDLKLLKSMARTMLEFGVEDLVLDPGTFLDEGLSDTINNFTMIRRDAIENGDKLFGFPLIGTPITAWLSEEISKELLQWKEAYVGSMLISRYADLLIMHSLDGWVLLPQVVWRFNIYTDPRKPVSVEQGVRTFGKPDENSPVLLTTNYALTYFTVESDIKAANLDCYLVVVDTGGISVESSVAGRYLTADSMAEALKEFKVEEKVKHRYLIIPGLAARLSGETEDSTGWRVIVGPRDSSGIPELIKTKWPPKEEE